MRNKNSKIPDTTKMYTCPGDQYHIIYSPKISPDGTIDLIPSGKEAIQEKIDSFRDQTDMSFIIHRLTVGDLSVLNVENGFYADLTQMPKTYAEALQRVIDAEDAFYKLPVDVRQKFDNDFNQWFAQAGTESWYDKMDSLIPKSSDVSEVKTNECI